jgi:hypothetical protein
MKSTDNKSTDNRPMFPENRPVTRTIGVLPGVLSPLQYA